MILGLLVFCGGFKSVAQNPYSVSPIPSQAYQALQDVAFTSDDRYSAIIPLTFNFDFFGNTFNEVVVSTNGYIDFSIANAQSFSPWQFNTTIPDVNFPVKNSFLGCYHDLYNMSEGTITYGIAGVAPYRKFVVIYNNNAQFYCLTESISSIQMVLYETLNILDSQIIRKDVCSTWNSGNAVIGVINSDGAIGITPPGRNTSVWTGDHEAWRFTPVQALNTYNFTKCDADADGFETFNLAVAQNDLNDANPNAVTFHATYNDAVSQANPLSVSYTNTNANAETIYANVNGAIFTVLLKVVDCNDDFDADTVATADEDLNNDTNLANDDTDGDGIPNFLDNDDDGDLVLTNEEYVFPRSNTQNPNAILDTDNDGIPNYLDNDDDGDNVLTINEDYNHNNNPTDDDTNANGMPDYLDNAVALGVITNQLQNDTVLIYPNPASDLLNINNKSGQSISNVAVYSITGMLVKTAKATGTLTTIPVSDLQGGIYFVNIEISDKVLNYKFIKK